MTKYFKGIWADIFFSYNLSYVLEYLEEIIFILREFTIFYLNMIQQCVSISIELKENIFKVENISVIKIEISSWCFYGCKIKKYL